MLYYSINDKVYELNFGNYYENKVSQYLHGQFLDFDNLDLEEKYQKVDELFGFVVRSFVGSFGGYPDEYPEYAYSEEIREITSRVSPVDRLQKYVHQKGNTERSIVLMNEFMEKVLSLRDKMLSEDRTVSLGG